MELFKKSIKMRKQATKNLEEKQQSLFFTALLA
jgi:hypothetical protein